MVCASVNQKYTLNNLSINKRFDHIPPMGPIKLGELSVPRGIFCTYDQHGYYPTCHGITDRTLGRMIYLTADGGRLRDNIDFIYYPGVHSIVNTGSEPLRLGDIFTVEIPTPEDSAAQEKCVGVLRTHNSCGGANFDETKPLWGGFLATKKLPTNELAAMEHKLLRDVDLFGNRKGVFTGSVLDMIFAIMELINVDAIRNHLGLLRQQRGTPDGVPLESIHALFSTDGFTTNLKRAMNFAADIIHSLDDSPFGKYMSSEFATPSANGRERVLSASAGQSNTGAAFKAYMHRF